MPQVKPDSRPATRYRTKRHAAADGLAGLVLHQLDALLLLADALAGRPLLDQEVPDREAERCDVGDEQEDQPECISDGTGDERQDEPDDVDADHDAVVDQPGDEANAPLCRGPDVGTGSGVALISLRRSTVCGSRLLIAGLLAAGRAVVRRCAGAWSAGGAW